MSDKKKYTVDDILAEYNGEDPETELTDGVPEQPAEKAGESPGNEETDSPMQEETEETEGTGSSLQEAEQTASSADEEQSESSGQEEYDNYEDGEEQDLSGSFAQEPMFKPAELFDGSSVDAVPEEISGTEEKEEEFETSEEIFAGENDNDENTDDQQELLEEDNPETDDKISIEEAGSGQDEDKESEAPYEAGTWAEKEIPEEITDVDVSEEPEKENKEAESGKGESSGDKPEENQKEKSGDKPEENQKEKSEDKPEENQNNISEEAAAEKISEEPEDVNDKFLVRLAKGIFPVKGDTVGEVIRKIIFLAALIVFIGAGVMLVSTLIQSDAAQKDKEKAGEIITTTVATYIDEDGNVVEIAPTEEEKAQHRFDVAEYYKGINPDYVGYLEVEGCEIYEPIVQGEDNDYYLKTNISGGYNKAGTVFMDYRCTFTADYESPNIVLYGHNQEDGTMFGNLKWYKQDVEFYKEHPSVKFSSEFETGEYLIYGFFVTHVYEKQDSNGEVFHYHDYIETLNDEYTFDWYLKEVQRRNQIVSPVDVKFGDKLLCLSTCSNEFTDSRFVVFARKLRDGETAEDYDFSKAYMNPNAEGVDWEAIMSGETTFVPEETDVIDEIPEETEAVTTRAKSNNKKNSGSGSKSGGEPSIVPPPAETTVTTVSGTKNTTTTTTTAATVTESSEETSGSDSESGSDASGTEADSSGTGEQDGSETEAPVQEGEQTETAV